MLSDKQDRQLQVLITAQEAYPVFEQRVLASKQEIVMGFRIFDPLTKLLSPEAQKVGSTWVDLLVDALGRGVSIELFLSDFDPVAATDLHRGCWRSVHLLCAVREIAGPNAAKLTVHPMLHPARSGMLPKLLFRPFVMRRLQAFRDKLNAMPDKERRKVLSDHPGMAWSLNQTASKNLESYPASHHQKTAVFDKEWLYVGGLDLDERRYDDKTHDQPAQDTWHDVQVLLKDPTTAQDAIQHLRTFGAVTRGQQGAASLPRLLRTMSADRGPRNIWSMSPKPVLTEIADRHIDFIKNARDLIYLETQFFRDHALAQALADRAMSNPKLHLILIIPGAPEEIAFNKMLPLHGRFGEHLQTRALRTVKRAFGSRLLVACPVQQRPVGPNDAEFERASLKGAPLVYVHAKVSIFDNDAAIVSSANLNGRSLKWDTETGVELTEPNEVNLVQRRVFEHWLPADIQPEAFDPLSAFSHWHRVAFDNAKKPPEDRRGFLVPYDAQAAKQTSRLVPGMPEEIV